VQFILAEHQGVEGTGTVRTLHRTLEPAVTVGHVGTDAGGTQVVDNTGHRLLRSLAEGHTIDIHATFLADGHALGLECEDGAIHTQAVTDAGEVLAAELGHEAVVTPTATDTGLCTEAVVDELEGGLGVVVKATDHTWVDLVGHTHVIEQAGDGLEVGAALVMEVVEHEWSIRGHLVHLRTLVIEHPQRVDLGAAAGLLIQGQVEEEILELLAVGGTAVAIPQAGQLEAETGQAQGPVAAVGQGDDLGIQGRIINTDGLHTDLLELTVTTRLGALIAEERPGIV